MRFSQLVGLLILAAGFLTQSGCDRVTKLTRSEAVAQPSPSPGAPFSDDDMRVARGTITIADVLAMLRRNVPNDTIIAEVKRRHIPQVLVDAGELELAANGANHRLIAALKDRANTLNEAQDKAYSLLLTERLKKSKTR